MAHSRSHPLGLPKSLAISLIYLVIWQQYAVAVVLPSRTAGDKKASSSGGGSPAPLDASEQAQRELAQSDPSQAAHSRKLQQEDAFAAGDAPSISPKLPQDDAVATSEASSIPELIEGAPCLRSRLIADGIE